MSFLIFGKVVSAGKQSFWNVVRNTGLLVKFNVFNFGRVLHNFAIWKKRIKLYKIGFLVKFDKITWELHIFNSCKTSLTSSQLTIWFSARCSSITSEHNSLNSCSSPTQLILLLFRYNSLGTNRPLSSGFLKKMQQLVFSFSHIV